MVRCSTDLLPVRPETNRNIVDTCHNLIDLSDSVVDDWSESVATANVPNVPTTTLSNGVEMPMLGLGTTHSGGYCHESVVYALKDCHYRMIDTAKRYGVERQLGLAIQDSGVARDNVFLISKLWPVDFGASVRSACLGSCKSLGTTYLDLYMTHFPEVPRWFEQPRLVKEETWRSLERLYDDGIIRAIGISNYCQTEIEEILEYCSIKPHVNQFEFHPYFNPTDLRQFCDAENIAFMGYCPLAKGTILDEEPIKRIATKHNRSPAQICIRWSIENRIPAIPKSRQKHRILENSQVFDFHLDTEDIRLLSGLHDPERKCIKLQNLQEKFTLPDGYKLNR